MSVLVSRAILSLAVLAVLSNASPLNQEARNKRDLMIEMEDDGLQNILFGDNNDDDDNDLLNRKRRDLMLEGGDSDDAGDIGQWLLEHFDARQTRHIDELPIGKRDLSAFNSQQQQKKNGGNHHGKKKSSIYYWFPDDTKHIRRPTAARSRVQQHGNSKNQHQQQQQFRLSDTFKFVN